MTITREEVGIVRCDGCSNRYFEDDAPQMIEVPVSWGDFQAVLQFDSKECLNSKEAIFDGMILDVFLIRTAEMPTIEPKQRNTARSRKTKTKTKRAPARPKGQSKHQENKDRIDADWAILEKEGFVRHRGQLKRAEMDCLAEAGRR